MTAVYAWGDAQPLVDALATYRLARREFLTTIGCRPASMREPLAEFAELLVAALTGEQMAESPVQQGWDLLAADGTTTQVRHVANASTAWVNEHHVRFVPGVDRYALVVYEALEPTAVIIFAREHMGEVCRRLGKCHPNQDTTLQLTAANVRQLRAESDPFAELGVRVYQ